jgi:hypothetical protein
MARWAARVRRVALLLGLVWAGVFGFQPTAGPAAPVAGLPQASGLQGAVAWPAAPEAVALLATDLAALPVPYYSQRDQRWGCSQLGTCGCNLNGCTSESFTTMADAGCYPTSQAMIFAYYAGGSFLDPGAYNECLRANQGYTAFPAACSSGACGALDDPPAGCRPAGVQYLGPSLDKAVLDDDLQNGHPAIAVVGVGVPGRLPHAVVVVGKRGGNYIVNDPFYGAAPHSRSEVSPGEIYGFHRWTGPLPGSVAAALPQAGALPQQPAAPPQGIPRPFAGDQAATTPAPAASRAAYAGDLTVPDGTALPAGRAFAKAWSMINRGEAAWPVGTRLEHVGGAPLGDRDAVPVPAARPGQAAAVVVPMRAPQSPGAVRSDWRLVTPDGTPFGPTLYVEITVTPRVSRFQNNWSMFEQAHRREG